MKFLDIYIILNSVYTQNAFIDKSGMCMSTFLLEMNFAKLYQITSLYISIDKIFLNLGIIRCFEARVVCWGILVILIHLVGFFSMKNEQIELF